LSRKPSLESLSTSINSTNENELMLKPSKANFLSVKMPNNNNTNKAANKSTHKRTNSYSVTMNSNSNVLSSSNHLNNKPNNSISNSRNNLNSNQYISHSDVEGSANVPSVAKNSGGHKSDKELVSSSNHLNVYNHQNYHTNVNGKTTNQSTYRSHHQHHHSISNPISTNDSFYKEYLNNYQSSSNAINNNNNNINGNGNNFYSKDKSNSKLSDLKII